MALLHYPKKVVLGDITVRDGFQHEEKFISTDAKLWLAEELILAGFKRLEVTNFGNPKVMPQFKDADELSKRLCTSKKVSHLINDVEITAITIRERAVERTIQAREEGYGPDRILFMVSTSESHHRTNSGLSLDEYWKMCETYIPKAHEAGMKVCGTVSTIWGCPIEGPTELKKAVEFTKRWLDIGADDIEHAKLLANDECRELPLPPEAEYMDDSFVVRDEWIEEVEHVERTCYCSMFERDEEDIVYCGPNCILRR